MAKDIEESPSTNPKGPAKLTFYPASIVNAHAPNDTGIFFPDKYVPSGTLDLLVYFHGLPKPCGGADTDRIWDIWRSKTFLLREWVNQSNKNVVLVAPRLSADSSGLHLDMAADEFLKTILASIEARVLAGPFNWQGTQSPAEDRCRPDPPIQFNRQGTQPSAEDRCRPDPPIKLNWQGNKPSTQSTASTRMSIGNLILAAHSGGGSPMLQMARTAKFAKVRECWGFDSMYGSPEKWVEWAALGGKYFLFWTTEGANDSAKYGKNVTRIRELLSKAKIPAGRNATKDPAAASAAIAAQNIVVVFAAQPDDADKGFARLPRRKFASSTPNHCLVPQTYWADMMNSF